MSLNLEETWIKAAVEHRLVTVTYVNPDTRLTYTKRDVRPVFVQKDPQSGRTALWGLLNHNPFVGVKTFTPEHFQLARITPQKFQADPNGKWKDLVPRYHELGLQTRES